MILVLNTYDLKLPSLLNFDCFCYLFYLVSLHEFVKTCIHLLKGKHNYLVELYLGVFFNKHEMNACIDFT